MALVPWPSSGGLHLRVRQLGFRFGERQLTRQSDNDDVRDTADFVLTRLPHRLAQVTAIAANQCPMQPDSSAARLAAATLEQLQQGAERYDAFRAAYPFRVTVLQRTVLPGVRNRPKVSEMTDDFASNEWGARYRPGRIVDAQSREINIDRLFLAALADTAFWSRHCFSSTGVQSIARWRVVRLAFSPSPEVQTADWEGSAYIDSATSVLRRLDFRLVRLGSLLPVRRYEGYTTFTTPSPLIVVPESTFTYWWHRNADDSGQWGPPDMAQLLVVQSISYRKTTPPSDTAAKR